MYRRLRGTPVWHFCTNCPQWPKIEYDISIKEPRVGNLCSHCTELKANESGEFELPSHHRLHDSEAQSH